MTAKKKKKLLPAWVRVQKQDDFKDKVFFLKMIWNISKQDDSFVRTLVWALVRTGYFFPVS